MNFERQFVASKALVDVYLSSLIREEKPASLYAPARYILDAGGKRIRPLLTMFACRAVGGNERDALHASAGIEILHNFTLVHDDIMDNAPSRRGRATVHTRWDTNVAILTGDALLALAYRALLRTSSDRIQEISRVFTEGVLEVCEGQAYDKEFETRNRVTVDDYLLMIRKKTGKLVSVATEIGGLVGGGTAQHLRALRKFGHLVGRAFQVQDDLLDVVGDERTFGKSIGGDLVEGKKSYLLLEAMRRAKGEDLKLLRKAVRDGESTVGGFRCTREIFRTSGAIEAAGYRIADDIAAAKDQLARLPDERGRSMLAWFADRLLHRTF